MLSVRPWLVSICTNQRKEITLSSHDRRRRRAFRRKVLASVLPCLKQILETSLDIFVPLLAQHLEIYVLFDGGVTRCAAFKLSRWRHVGDSLSNMNSFVMKFSIIFFLVRL